MTDENGMEVESSDGDRGGKSLVRRHPVLAVGLVVSVLFVAAIAWYLGSPLFISRTVVEDFPVATSTGEAESPADDLVSPSPRVAGPVALEAGVLRGVGHRSSGTATVYRLEDGKRILRLEHDTENGPDLFVYLIAASDYEKKSDADDFVDLGPLKGNVGAQNYEIPDSVDLSRYQTVMIWCRRFATPFAAAPMMPAQVRGAPSDGGVELPL